MILIGDSGKLYPHSQSLYVGIGKSCIMKRLTTGDFKEDHDVTVGVEFTGYDIRIEDMVIRLQIWDTAG